VKSTVLHFSLFTSHFSLLTSHFLHKSHPAQDFFLVVPEKTKLAENKGNGHKDHLVTKYEYEEAKQYLPEPGSLVVETHPGGDFPRNPGRGGAGNGKNTENQEELGATDLPLVLEPLKHGAKRGKNLSKALRKKE
jgi:hypothetical protein